MTRPLYHVMSSPHARLTPETIDFAVEVVRDGCEHEHDHADFRASDIVVAAYEVLEAERLTDDLSGVSDRELAPRGDWALACVAEVQRQAAELLRARGDAEQADSFTRKERRSLLKLAEGPWRSPTLNYGDIFSGFVNERVRQRDRSAFDMLHRKLSYDVFHEPRNLRGDLRELAWYRTKFGEREAALRIYTGLLRDDPRDLWTYNAIALDLPQHGLPGLALEAVERGLVLIEQGVERGLEAQLRRSAEQLRGLRDEADGAVVRRLRTALTLDPDQSRPRTPRALCKALAPEALEIEPKLGPARVEGAALDQLRRDLRTLPRPLPKPRVPVGVSLVPATAAGRGVRVGRNDACPCQSGRKYKRCCAVAPGLKA